MSERQEASPAKSGIPRRTAIQAGAIGAIGLPHLAALRAAGPNPPRPAKSVIFIFLTGGLSHHDSFDMKPHAPEGVRGEFHPIATRTPGLQICEHLPLLAQLSEKYALVRSVGTDSNSHELACHMLLTGRLDLPAGFNTRDAPSPNEWPSIPSQVTYALAGHTRMPPAAVLPQPSVNEAARVRPGQYAGRLGPRFEAWHIDIAAQCPLGNGACPECFRHDAEPEFRHAAPNIFDTPLLQLPAGGSDRLSRRVSLLDHIESQRHEWDRIADAGKLDRHRQQALNVLIDPQTRSAFDVEAADPLTLHRYGKNKFGLSLLMAQRLVASGVALVQVNLGKNSSWDTHRRNFINLRENLFPYFDRAVSAFLEDMSASGLLDETLVVLAGEFGRTPKINKDAGRDHWGPVNTMLFAGGGVQGGRVIGASDAIGAYPIADRQTPENVAATMYAALGIPREAEWIDVDGRPHSIYRAEPIAALM